MLVASITIGRLSGRTHVASLVHRAEIALPAPGEEVMVLGGSTTYPLGWGKRAVLATTDPSLIVRSFGGYEVTPCGSAADMLVKIAAELRRAKRIDAAINLESAISGLRSKSMVSVNGSIAALLAVEQNVAATQPERVHELKAFEKAQRLMKHLCDLWSHIDESARRRTFKACGHGQRLFDDGVYIEHRRVREDE